MTAQMFCARVVPIVKKTKKNMALILMFHRISRPLATHVGDVYKNKNFQLVWDFDGKIAQVLTLKKREDRRNQLCTTTKWLAVLPF